MATSKKGFIVERHVTGGRFYEEWVALFVTTDKSTAKIIGNRKYTAPLANRKEESGISGYELRVREVEITDNISEQFREEYEEILRYRKQVAKN